ncbi:ABC transporter [Fragilaria crotonensis]|nr:ABC transporter [Fragilaria crotonensis]
MKREKKEMYQELLTYDTLELVAGGLSSRSCSGGRRTSQRFRDKFLPRNLRPWPLGAWFDAPSHHDGSAPPGASKKLHEDLTASVLRAPVAFFDVTPVGRILNRFSADMDKIDLQLTQSLGQGISTIFSVLGAIAAIIAATKGTFLVPLIPIGYIYYVIQKWFRKTSTELQRVNSIANSPIFADFSQTLSGTSTIRAYGEESRFFAQCQQSFDTMNASYVLVQLTSNWLGLRLDVLGGIIGAFIEELLLAPIPATSSLLAGWVWRFHTPLRSQDISSTEFA